MFHIDPANINSQQIGRMGELIVELELISRGWTVGNFNASTINSLGWDIFAARPGSSIKIRVKAKRPGTDCFRWSAKADGSVLLGLAENDDTDFVAAVDFQESGGYYVYILHSAIVEQTLRENHAAYLAQPKRDGSAKKDSSQRNLFMNERTRHPGHGYRREWKKYRNAWDQFLPQS